MKQRLLVPAFALLLTSIFTLAFAQPWYARGDFNGWDLSSEMLDDGVAPDAAASDGIYTVDVFTTLGAFPGFQEWKAANSDWSVSYPGQNSRIWIASANTTYTLTFNTTAQGDGWVPDQNFVSFSPITDVANGPFTAVGSYNGGEWDAANAANHMFKAPDGTFYLYKVIATAGTWEYKVAFNDDWTIQIGANGWENNASTMNFTTTTDNQMVILKVDPVLGRLKVDLTPPDLSVKINEISIDDAGTDDEEFIELYGPGSKDLTGWTLQFVNGANGTVYRTTNLVAIPADGFYVIAGSASCPNLDLQDGPATDMIQNGNPDAVRLLDANGNVVDSLGYEMRPGGPYLIYPGTDYEGPGIWMSVGNTGWDSNNYTHSRSLDGLDTDNNELDFVHLPATPGFSNSTARGLLPVYTNNFDDAAGTGYGADFWGTYTDPTATAPGVGFAPIASPQGGNFAVFSDTSGGGDASVFMSEAVTDIILECYVYINPATLPASETEYWSIVVRGKTDIFYNSPVGTFNGETGIIWNYAHDDSGSTLTLAQEVANVREVVYLEQNLASYTGWQRLRVEVEGSTVTGYLGGDYGTQIAPVTGTGSTTIEIGGIGFGFREYVTDNLNSTPWFCIDAMTIAQIPPSRVDDWLVH